MKPTKIRAKKSKILVVFYSRTGNTKKAAEALARELKATTEEVIDLKKRKGVSGIVSIIKDVFLQHCTRLAKLINNPQDYNLVVIGTPVWAFNVSCAIRSYLQTANLKNKKVAFFCTCGSSGAERTFAIMKQLAKGAEVIGTLGLTSRDMDELDRKANEFAVELLKSLKKESFKKRTAPLNKDSK